MVNDELRIPLNNKENISNKVTRWSNTLSDVNYPSEKLVKDTIDSLLDLIYPIGSIYMSVNSTSPSLLFGGRWIQIKDRFLLASGDTYTNGNTGGEATHTLTVDEMPSHNHTAGKYDDYELGNEGFASGSKTGVYVDTSSSNSSTRIHTNYTGSGQAHNNMPPYLTVYVWERVEDYDYIINTVEELTDALTNVSEGESIYINSGTYTLSQQYSLPSCTIIGNNATLVEIGLVFDQDTTSPIHIKGLVFDGNNVQNMRTFIDLDYGTFDVHIHECTFTNKRADWNGDIINIHNSSADHTIEIDHCTFTGDNYCKGYGHSKGSIIYFGNDGHPDAYNIIIHHNTFDHNENVGDSGNLYNGRAICFIDATLHDSIAYCNTYIGSGDTNNGITESQCPD